MNPQYIHFFVPGLPAPGGSKRVFIHKATGRLLAVDACKRNKDWRRTVALYAKEAMKGRPPFQGPVGLRLYFHMPRPARHFNKSGLKPDAPDYHTQRPDTLKLARSVEDALTGIVYADDAQIAEGIYRKAWSQWECEPAPGVTVGVYIHEN